MRQPFPSFTRNSPPVFVRRFAIAGLLAVTVLVPGMALLRDSVSARAALPSPRVYVALEGAGTVLAIDPQGKRVVDRIQLARTIHGSRVSFSPHNVQIDPRSGRLWVTANAAMESMKGMDMGNHSDTSVPDEVVVVDGRTDRIIKRVAVGAHLHLAHVVVAPDGRYAYATAQEAGVVFRINTRTFRIEKRIRLGSKSQPHGLRIAPQGTTAYVAMLGGGGLRAVSLRTGQVRHLGVTGKGVQAGVTRNGRYAMVSLFDTRRLAIMATATKSVRYVQLPREAKGPVQMYATPDSRFVYLADQGLYFNQPVSRWVYKIDIARARVVKRISAGLGPHGVAVSTDGRSVYVTNIVGGSLSLIDTRSDREVARIPVGKEPNGVTVWENK